MTTSAPARLRLVVRTPRAVVAELDVAALRVPTESGHVGIRPGGERILTPVEPGLALARTADATIFFGTAGGLLRSGRSLAVLLTPIAFTGEDPGAVLRAIEAALAAPDPELELRRAIGRLEAGMLRELGAVAPSGTAGARRHA